MKSLAKNSLAKNSLANSDWKRWTVALVCVVAGVIAAMVTAGHGQPTPDAQMQPGMQQDDGQTPDMSQDNGAADMTPDQTEEADATTQPATAPTSEPVVYAPLEAQTMAGLNRRTTRIGATRTRAGQGKGVQWTGGGPTTNWAAAPMSKQYSILETRSIFVKGHAADTTHSNIDHGTPPPMPTTWPSAPRQESSLLFTGVIISSQQTLALVEDTVSGRVMTVKTGDPLGPGKVTKISLDELQYQSATKQMVIKIGQNLEGNAVTPPAPTGSTGADSGSGGGGASDILEKMRAKRAAELGH